MWPVSTGGTPLRKPMPVSIIGASRSLPERPRRSANPASVGWNSSDATPGDYSYTATVHHEAVDGKPDTHPDDDVCPRSALRIDPNPDGTINDKGCVAKMTNVLKK